MFVAGVSLGKTDKQGEMRLGGNDWGGEGGRRKRDRAARGTREANFPVEMECVWASLFKLN